MKLYNENQNYKLYHGSMLDMSDVINPSSIDSIVTDPPYELNFMGKGWDNSGIAFNKETWQKCYEVLKPGGYLLAFGGSRTYHRIACAIEDAGFEIRDCIMWLYGSGFPKSMNIGLAIDKKMGIESTVVGTKKEHDIRNNNYANNDVSTKTFIREIKKAKSVWSGWGTCLKPAYEPIIIARKPFKGSLVDNVIENGVGGLNIDECRVATNGEKIAVAKEFLSNYATDKESYRFKQSKAELIEQGRFPANVILTYNETDFEEVCGEMPETKSSARPNSNGKIYHKEQICYGDYNDIPINLNYIDEGSASRYFYCAKASKKDRDEGLDGFEEKEQKTIYNDGFNSATKLTTDFQKETGIIENRTLRKNIHPTVKPTELMQYLVRLVTPKNGTVFDPFMGSGSTGKAVMYENNERNANYKFIGIELTEEYLPIAHARIDYVNNFKNKEDKQLSLF